MRRRAGGGRLFLRAELSEEVVATSRIRIIGAVLGGSGGELGTRRGGQGGVQSGRHLKAQLKAVSNLSYDFRREGRIELFGISEMSVAFYVFLPSLVSRG